MQKLGFLHLPGAPRRQRLGPSRPNWGLSLESGHASILILGQFPVLARGFAHSVPDGMSQSLCCVNVLGPRGDTDRNALVSSLCPWPEQLSPAASGLPKGPRPSLGVKAALTEGRGDGN